MKILKYIGIGLLAIIVIFLVLGLFLPKDFKVERSTEINRPAAVVFEQVKSLQNQQKWSPWADYDPNMKVSYEGNAGEVGSSSHWEGNKDVGKGSQQITAVTASRVESKIHFIEPFESTSDAYIQLESSSPDATKVTWGFKGKNPYPFNVMCLFMDMDKMVGKDFEKGLNKLKTICEQ